MSAWHDWWIDVVGPKQEKKSAWHDWWIDVVGPKQEKSQLGMTGG